jgi:hypothetical protein
MELQSKGMQIELNCISPIEITLADSSARIHTASYVKIHITLKVYENLTLRDRIFYVVDLFLFLFRLLAGGVSLSGSQV